MGFIRNFVFLSSSAVVLISSLGSQPAFAGTTVPREEWAAGQASHPLSRSLTRKVIKKRGIASRGENHPASQNVGNQVRRHSLLDRTNKLKNVWKKPAPSEVSLGTSFTSIAKAQANAGNEDAAISYWTKAVAFKDRKPEELANTYKSLGMSCYKKGDHEAAFANLRKSLTFTQPNQVPFVADFDVFNTFYGLGNAFYNGGQFEKSISAFEVALFLSDKRVTPSIRTINRGNTFNNLGYVNSAAGKFDNAIFYYNQALLLRDSKNNLARTGKDRVMTLENLGYAHSGKGNFWDAILAWQGALDVKDNDGNPSATDEKRSRIETLISNTQGPTAPISSGSSE